MPHPELFAALRPGAYLLIDDGRVRLRMLAVETDSATAEVVQGDSLSNRKGVSLPGGVIPLSPLTPKDRIDLGFALRLGVNWVALSFVQRAAGRSCAALSGERRRSWPRSRSRRP